MTKNSTDTLIEINRDMIEQNHQQALAQVLTTRTPGYNLNINGDLPAGSQFDLTDQDDNVTIVGNLMDTSSQNTGGITTIIKLKTGNDTLNIEGSKITGNPDTTFNRVYINGTHDEKIINFNNGLEISNAHFQMSLIGSGNRTLTISGDYSLEGYNSANKQSSTSQIFFGNNNSGGPSATSGLHNDMIINGNVITKNHAHSSFSENGSAYANTKSTFYILGDVIASNYSRNHINQSSRILNIKIDGGVTTEKNSYNFINQYSYTDKTVLKIGEKIYTNQYGYTYISANGIDTYLETGAIKTDNNSKFFIRTNKENNNFYFEKSITNLIINGNVESSNNSTNSISINVNSYNNKNENSTASLEVNGTFISNSGSSNIITADTEVDTLTLLGGFIANGGKNIVDTGAGNDDIYIEGDINAINGNTNGGGSNSIVLGAGDDIFALDGNISSINGGNNKIDGSDGNDLLTVNGNIIASDDGINSILLGADNDELTINGDISALNNGKNNIDAGTGDDIITLDGHLTTYNGGTNTINLSTGDDVFTLKGSINASSGGVNTIDLGAGNDTFTLTGDVGASGNGLTTIYGGDGNDTFSLKGQIQSGSLNVYGGEGDDTLILSATTQAQFDTNYKEWLTDLGSSGNLADSGIETIRLDVSRGTVSVSKLGWLVDLIDQANADGAHITLEDNKGNVLTEPQLYLSFNAAADANPIDALLDEVIPHSTESAGVKSVSLETPYQAWEQNHSFDFANSNNPAQYLEEVSQAMLVG